MSQSVLNDGIAARAPGGTFIAEKYRDDRRQKYDKQSAEADKLAESVSLLSLQLDSRAARNRATVLQTEASTNSLSLKWDALADSLSGGGNNNKRMTNQVEGASSSSALPTMTESDGMHLRATQKAVRFWASLYEADEAAAKDRAFFDQTALYVKASGERYAPGIGAAGPFPDSHPLSGASGYAGSGLTSRKSDQFALLAQTVGVPHEFNASDSLMLPSRWGENLPAMFDGKQVAGTEIIMNPVLQDDGWFGETVLPFEVKNDTTVLQFLKLQFDDHVMHRLAYQSPTRTATYSMSQTELAMVLWGFGWGMKIDSYLTPRGQLINAYHRLQTGAACRRTFLQAAQFAVFSSKFCVRPRLRIHAAGAMPLRKLKLIMDEEVRTADVVRKHHNPCEALTQMLKKQLELNSVDTSENNVSLELSGAIRDFVRQNSRGYQFALDGPQMGQMVSLTPKALGVTSVIFADPWDQGMGTETEVDYSRGTVEIGYFSVIDGKDPANFNSTGDSKSRHVNTNGLSRIYHFGTDTATSSDPDALLKRSGMFLDLGDAKRPGKHVHRDGTSWFVTPTAYNSANAGARRIVDWALSLGFPGAYIFSKKKPYFSSDRNVADDLQKAAALAEEDQALIALKNRVRQGGPLSSGPEVEEFAALVVQNYDCLVESFFTSSQFETMAKCVQEAMETTPTLELKSHLGVDEKGQAIAGADGVDFIAVRAQLGKCVVSQRFFELFHRHQLPLFEMYIEATPGIRFETAAAAMTARGCGKTITGLARLDQSTDSAAGKVSFRFQVHFKSAVLNPERVAVKGDALYTGYVSGDSRKDSAYADWNRPLDPTSDGNPAKRTLADIDHYVMFIPPRATVVPTGVRADLFGSFSHHLCSDRQELPHYDTAPIYGRLLKSLWKEWSQGSCAATYLCTLNHDGRIALRNTVMHQQYSETWVNGKWEKKVDSAGHLGEAVKPGFCQAMISYANHLRGLAA